MPETPAPRYVRSENVKLKQVGGSAAAYVGEQKALHVLNPVARLLLEYLSEPADLDELRLMLEMATDGSPETISEDLPAALRQLEELRIVRRV